VFVFRNLHARASDPFEDRLKARLGRLQLLVQAFPQFRDFLSDQWLIA
jgi:hypothetical protein